MLISKEPAIVSTAKSKLSLLSFIWENLFRIDNPTIVKTVQIAFTSFKPPIKAESIKIGIKEGGLGFCINKSENKNKQSVTLNKCVFAAAIHPQISHRPSNNKKYKLAVNINEKINPEENETVLFKNERQ